MKNEEERKRNRGVVGVKGARRLGITHIRSERGLPPAAKGFAHVVRHCADMSDMHGVTIERSERRTAMMAVAKVTWEDPPGAIRDASVKIEDTSCCGACIRITTPISVGSKLRVDWRGGRFTGVAKYCRAYREEYIIGIKRDVRDEAAPRSPSARSVTNKIVAPTSMDATGLASLPQRNHEESHKNREPRASAMLATMDSPGAADRGAVDCTRESKTTSGDLRSTQQDHSGLAQVRADQPSHKEERTHMLSKWLHRPSRHDGNEALSGQSGETPVSSGGKNAASESGNDARPRVNRQDATGLKPRGDLLPLEDIYRAKGITGLRMGYSIHKVVEMLTSNHVRELSNEMKRASVLMALDVAGIPLDEVLNDAKRRLEALNSYESDQEQHLADYEVRKVQENNEIQLEMERITAHYLERLKRNVDEIALVRSPFANWQAMKQQETQRISEAVELCTNQIASESRNTSPSAVQTLSVVRQPAAPVSGKMSRA